MLRGGAKKEKKRRFNQEINVSSLSDLEQELYHEDDGVVFT